jgi:hypothetical protein
MRSTYRGKQTRSSMSCIMEVRVPLKKNCTGENSVNTKEENC